MSSRIKYRTGTGTVIIRWNMDWTAKMGTQLYVMPKGIERQGMVDENPAKWTSKYGSVVSTVWECVVADGMNEAGLTARMLYLAETQYEKRDHCPPRGFHLHLGAVLPRQLCDGGRSGRGWEIDQEIAAALQAQTPWYG